MTGRRSTAERLAARLGLFAVLFQAILFGWHHHDSVWAGRLPVPVVGNPTGPPQVVDDEDGCEICQVFHHLTAAPPDLVAALAVPTVALISEGGGAAFLGHSPTLGFLARAPPAA